MNKIKYLIIPMLSIIGVFLCNQKVQAETYEYLTVDYQPNVFYQMTGDGYYSADQYANYSMNGKTVYCVEQGVPLYTLSYIGVEGFGSSPFSQDINRMIELIGHYGYDYPNHQTLRYRMATQALIWETITGYHVDYFTENYGYGDYINIDYEKNEIMSLVNTHYLKPSFDSQTFDMKLNETIEIEDFNNKIGEFQVFNSNNHDVRIENNKLIISAKNIGQSEISFIKKYYDNSTTFFYNANDGRSQKLAFFRTKDPVLSYLNINVIGGKIRIKKVDSETNSTQAQGQGSLVGAVYNVLDKDGNIVSTLTIGDDNTATTDYLPSGTYYIKEVSSSNGYYINNEIYTVEINSSDIYDIIVKENIIKGKIKVIKYDSETNSCNSQGQASLIGAKYGIYDNNNNLVDTLTIGDDCTAISKDLPYGDYMIKEISSSIGYDIDTNIYNATINSSATITITSKENIIKGKIQIKKLDSETNTCKAQGNASLVGAKYGIYDSNNNLVDTLTIGDDCTALSEDLPYGNYRVKEVSSSIGYRVDTNIYDATINSSATITITSKENIIKGKIQIKKLDSETNSCNSQGQASLVGAKYGIYDSNNNLVDTLIIGDDCTAVSKDLPYGNYRIKEIESSLGYELDTNIYDANIINNNVINIISKENVIKGKIKVIKYDSETNSCESQGQGTLVGAKYGIYDNNNNLVDTLIIKNDCTATSKFLPYGSYTIKEIESSLGYMIDTKIYSADIVASNKIISIVSKDKVVKNFISILKQYEYVDEDTKLLNAEANIIFEIFDSNNVKFKQIITDENGYATLELPFGMWKFHQVNTTNGYQKMNDFYVNVDENTKNTQYYNILNNKLSAYLQVFKVDVETGEVIAIKNTAFKILNTDTNTYISQYVGGKLLDTFFTDETGKMVTYLKLESGNYKLIEIDSPNGYLLDEDGLIFSIDEDTDYEYTDYGAIVTVYFKNSAIKGQIEVNKKGENFVINNGEFSYEYINLDNVTFEIYASEDIKSADGNYLYYSKGDLVDTITTDKNGYTISKKLPLGKYYLIETKTKEGYVLENEKYYFELTEIDNKTSIVYASYSATNYLKKGTLEFTKTDLVDGTPIPNTTIEVYNENEELIFTGETDKDGKIIIDNLVIGKYYIVEKESATGYILSDKKVYFEIKDNGEIVKANMTNEKITGKLEFTKVDLVDGTPIPNVEIAIYDEFDEEVFCGITDSKGQIIINELEYGKYYIVEKETATGYILSDEKVFFEIKEDGEIVKAKMTNEKIVEVPNTNLNDSKALNLVGGIFFILGVVYLIYDSRKQKK